jgi:hypothetical protein
MDYKMEILELPTTTKTKKEFIKEFMDNEYCITKYGFKVEIPYSQCSEEQCKRCINNAINGIEFLPVSNKKDSIHNHKKLKELCTIMYDDCKGIVNDYKNGHISREFANGIIINSQIILDDIEEIWGISMKDLMVENFYIKEDNNK